MATRPSVVPFAWLCLAEDGLADASVGTMLESAEFTLATQWVTRTHRRTRSKILQSIRRTNPPAVVILSGEETPTPIAAAYHIAEAFVRQAMVSPYAEQSIVRTLHDNPDWLIEEKRYSTRHFALRRLEQLVIHDVSEGYVQPHAVVVLDGDNLPELVETAVDVVLALSCMSEETRHHPALQEHRENLFSVVVEKP